MGMAVSTLAEQSKMLLNCRVLHPHHSASYRQQSYRHAAPCIRIDCHLHCRSVTYSAGGTASKTYVADMSQATVALAHCRARDQTLLYFLLETQSTHQTAAAFVAHIDIHCIIRKVFAQCVLLLQAFRCDQGSWSDVQRLIQELPCTPDVVISNAALGSATVEQYEPDPNRQDLAMMQVRSGLLYSPSLLHCLSQMYRP